MNVRLPTHRAPTHPGEILLKEFLEPMGITQSELAGAIDTSFNRINEIVNGKRGISTSTALRLAKFFGTSADLWLNLQLSWEIYETREAEKKVLARIKTYRPPEQQSAAD
jgi:addiction module HigA family antidote